MKEKNEKTENLVTVTPQSQYRPYGIMPDGTLVMQERTDISTFSNEELIAEIKRRGWKGKLKIVQQITL